jgi:hypothetical protein
VKAGVRKRNGSRTPPLSCPRPDKPGAPTWVGDDRRRCPLCSECGHRLVTGSVVGRSQTGYQLPRFKPVLGH